MQPEVFFITSLAMSTHSAFVNDRLVDAQDAVIPITDRGFRFGDAIFETLPVHRGVPYHFEKHMHRLIAGLSMCRIPNPKTPIEDAVRALLQGKTSLNATIRITVSRGSGSIGYLPKGKESTLVAEYEPYESGNVPPVTLIYSQWRRFSPNQLPSTFKLAQGMQSSLAMMEAQDMGADSAILLDAEGHVSECANANIFWLKNNILYTPALTSGCVAGITRALILELSPWQIAKTAAEPIILERADAIAISNARSGLRAVTRVGKKNHYPTEFWQPLQEALMLDKERYTQANTARWI